MGVFDKMLALLEHITEFLKHGHAAEVARVLDNGVFAYAEAKNTADLEHPHLLVQQAKNLKDRVGEFLRKTQNLINIQEKENKTLKERINNVSHVLDGHVSGFILRTKEYLISPNSENQSHRQAAYNDVKACLDEINKILQRIKAKYTNSFDEGQLKIEQDLDEIDDKAIELMKTLGQLHAPAVTPDMEAAKIEHARALPGKTQEMLSVMAQAGADPELKRELVGAVKHGRDGGLPEYFESCDTIEGVARKSKMAAPLSLAIPVPIEEAKAINPIDMLEAAKRMCAALKGINLALDD